MAAGPPPPHRLCGPPRRPRRVCCRADCWPSPLRPGHSVRRSACRPARACASLTEQPCSCSASAHWPARPCALRCVALHAGRRRRASATARAVALAGWHAHARTSLAAPPCSCSTPAHRSACPLALLRALTCIPRVDSR